MAIGLVKGLSTLAITEEVTEGTYVAPSSAADFVEVLEDGLETGTTRESIENNTLSATVEAEAPRLGVKTVSASFGLPYKANASEGTAPPMDRLLKSLLGGKRSIGTATTSKSSGHTSTSIKIEDADISTFAKNDVLLFKVGGAYEIRPVSAVVTTPGSGALTLAFALKNGAPSGAVTIAKMTSYFPDDGWTTLSASLYQGGQILDALSGLRCLKGEISDWTTGQVPSMSFELEGVESDRTVDTPSYTPDFSADAQAPVMLDACAYLGGVEVDYNEFQLSIENTKADIPSACRASGKAGSRITELRVSGSIDPYMEDDDVSRWDDFKNNADTSLLVFAYNPKSPAVDGEFRQAVAIWMPKIKITELGTPDQDGVLQDAISFQAFRGAGNDSVFVAFL